MKAWKFLGAPLMFMLLTGMPWCIASAANDTTEPVTANSGEHVTVGNVDVTGNGSAVAVSTNNEQSASAKVNGNVTFTNQSGGIAAFAQGDKGDASVDVSGNISTTTGCVGYGVGAASMNGGNAEANVGGNITVKSDTSAYGVDSYSGDVNVAGNVTAEGPTSLGVSAMTDKKTSVKVNGSVNSTGYDALGIKLQTLGPADADLNVTVGNGVNVESTIECDYSSAQGISVLNSGGKITADITGDVVTKVVKGMSCGIEIPRMDGTEPADGSSNTILIHGNLTSDGIGIHKSTTSSPTVTNILVEDEIQAKTVGVLSETAPLGDGTDTSESGKFNLTVWKIKLNENGNAAEYNIDPGYFPDGIVPEDVVTHGADKEFEKRIMYIIKLEQPGEGGKIKAVNAKGKALSKSFGFDVAHEGDKIILKANLAKGFKIIAAYNGNGEKETLLKDENGNYYIIVPKGGGVYLSVELEDTTEHSYTDSDDEQSACEISDEKSAEGSAKNSAVPKTGDESQTTPWFLLFSVAAIGSIAGTKVCGKKNQKESI